MVAAVSSVILNPVRCMHEALADHSRQADVSTFAYNVSALLGNLSALVLAQVAVVFTNVWK